MRSNRTDKSVHYCVISLKNRINTNQKLSKMKALMRGSSN